MRRRGPARSPTGHGTSDGRRSPQVRAPDPLRHHEDHERRSAPSRDDPGDRRARADLGCARAVPGAVRGRRHLIKGNPGGNRVLWMPRPTKSSSTVPAAVVLVSDGHGTLPAHHRRRARDREHVGERPSYVAAVIKVRRSVGKEQSGAGAATAAASERHDAPTHPIRSTAAGMPISASASRSTVIRRPVPITSRYPGAGRRTPPGLVTYRAMPRSSRRIAAPLIVALALLVPLVLSAPAPAAQSDQDLINLACSLPHRYLVRTWNGFSPDRGPELTAIPAEPNFMGAGLPHVGPWTTSSTCRCSGTGPVTSRPRARRGNVPWPISPRRRPRS